MAKADGPGVKITAVVVLFRLRPDQSSTISSLVRSFDHKGAGGADLSLLVYDNSPEAQPFNVPLPFEHRYFHDPLNGGLAEPYNQALDSDPGDRGGWLLLLDQDSELPENFLEETLLALDRVGRDGDVAAVVPKALQRGRPVSPALINCGRVKPVKNISSGLGRPGLTAINSGALVRKSFVQGIGGFNREFKLDYLDHWLFSEIGRLGKKIYVTGAVIKHDLSVRNGSPLTPGRFRSIREAETLFYREHASGWNFACHVLNLALRSIRYLFQGRGGDSLMTARHFFSVLATLKP